jgi:actin-binding protein IPP
MTYQREHLTARFIGSKLYAAGGRIPTNRQLNYAESYDTTTNTWTTLSTLPTGRSGLHSTVVNGKMYTFGGEGNGGSGIFSNVEAYDPTTSSWNCYYPMIYPRHGTAVMNRGDLVHIILSSPACYYSFFIQ